jgi:hypothetical protein
MLSSYRKQDSPAIKIGRDDLKSTRDSAKYKSQPFTQLQLQLEVQLKLESAASRPRQSLRLHDSCKTTRF